MHDTIVFDLGGVLIDWNPRYYYRNRFKSKEAMEYFLHNIATNEWNEEQDGGRLISDATALLKTQFPHYTSEIEDYYTNWVHMLNGTFDGSVEILKSLIENPKYKVYSLTNWSAETWPKATKIFEFLNWFDGIIVSGQEKMKKPNREIFDLLIDRFQLDIPKTIFIDDNEQNVIAARSMGIPTIHFRDADQLKEELLAMQVELT